MKKQLKPAIKNPVPHQSELISLLEHYQNRRYEEAEKLSLRMTKKISNSYIYFVDLYMVQLKNGNDRKAKKTLEKINSKLKKKDAQVVSVANTFIKYQMYNQALKCYQVVIENNTKRKSTYRMQIAQLYLYLDKDVQMVEEYLTLIEENPTQKQTVQNYLQRYLNNDGIKSDKNYNAVKNGLLKYSQKEREGHLFTEMLIWLFMQNNQFDLAFLQAKALDKRLVTIFSKASLSNQPIIDSCMLLWYSSAWVFAL